MRLYSDTRINASDYPEELQETMDQFGEIYNSFVDEVKIILNGNIDFENLNQALIQIEIQVDENGIPVQGGKINIPTKIQPQGFTVISASNLTNKSKYVKSHPFITAVPLGNGISSILHVAGLEAGERYRLRVIVY